MIYDKEPRKRLNLNLKNRQRRPARSTKKLILQLSLLNSMKKSVILLLLLLTLIVSACSGIKGGDGPRDTAALIREVQSGTQGVEVSILPNFPPDQIYDQSELTTIVEIKNKNNHDLQPQECFLQVTGFDPQIISGDINAPRSCADGVGTLEGKNIYNTQGGFNQIEFSSTNTRLPTDV